MLEEGFSWLARSAIVCSAIGTELHSFGLYVDSPRLLPPGLYWLLIVSSLLVGFGLCRIAWLQFRLLRRYTLFRESSAIIEATWLRVLALRLAILHALITVAWGLLAVRYNYLLDLFPIGAVPLGFVLEGIYVLIRGALAALGLLLFALCMNIVFDLMWHRHADSNAGGSGSETRSLQ